jgi:uncharacterized protein (TIGR03067 family)
MYPSLLAALAVTLGAPAPKAPKPHPIVGTWQILTRTFDGNTTDVEGGIHCWTFTADGRRGGHTTGTKPGPTTVWSKYELDEKVRPATLNVIHEYPGRTLTDHFLFEFDGDTLTVCINVTQVGVRPKSITGAKGSGNNLYKLRRVKAKE